MNIEEAHKKYQHYKSLFEDELIKEHEYLDLLKTIALEEIIAESAEELELKETLNLLLTSSISAIQAIV